MDKTDVRFKVLASLGAGEFEHLNGKLIKHLTGTYALLKAWKATGYLSDAGLFHAAYGTAGFDESMVSLDQRTKITGVIGVEAEALVYLYCSCDRAFVFDRKIANRPIFFRDRFTEKTFHLEETQARALCELTVANELELLLSSDEFAAKYGAELFELFENIQFYLTDTAIQAYQSYLAR